MQRSKIDEIFVPIWIFAAAFKVDHNQVFVSLSCRAIDEYGLVNIVFNLQSNLDWNLIVGRFCYKDVSYTLGSVVLIFDSDRQLRGDLFMPSVFKSWNIRPNCSSIEADLAILRVTFDVGKSGHCIKAVNWRIPDKSDCQLTSY